MAGLRLALLATLVCFRIVSSVPSGDLLRRNNTLPTINEYLERRADLVAEERAIRFDAGAIRNATAKELKAVEIVDALRRPEQQSVWYADPNKEPGMPFLWARGAIDEYSLGTPRGGLLMLNRNQSAHRLVQNYQKESQMPKGALLHAHSDAIVDAKYLLQLALDYPSIHPTNGIRSQFICAIPNSRIQAFVASRG
ncbi:hypothetical protein FRC11_010046 [Ceratobasidium sp. 423]|nr:hypothetical protein FRC11_010046 [Ceratobasidium sp. 423]